LIALAERSETASILKDIRIPALILCGSEDSVTVPEQSEFLHQHITDSFYHLIDGAGHMSNLEKPGEFNRYLKDFLDHLK
jgi:pimeloyl-ACP methyl ester carboxylesterase